MRIKKYLILETLISILIPTAVLSFFVLLSKFKVISPIQIDYLLPLAITVAALLYLKFRRISLRDIGITFQEIKLSLLYSSIFIIIFLLINILIRQPTLNITKPISLLFFGLYSIFIIALGEEAWFRGIIFNLLGKLHGKYFSLVVSSILFGVFHLRHGMDAIFFALIFGLCFGFIRLKTKNILGLILSHGLFITINVYLLI